jgi:hypothetical protein
MKRKKSEAEHCLQLEEMTPRVSSNTEFRLFRPELLPWAGTLYTVQMYIEHCTVYMKEKEVTFAVQS